MRHARARNIETQINYEPNRLFVAVKDDGCGIDPEMLDAGRAGHWGLTGMRGRAESIGAHLMFSATRARDGDSLWCRAMLAFELTPMRGSSELNQPRGGDYD